MTSSDKNPFNPLNLWEKMPHKRKQKKEPKKNKEKA